MLDSQAKPTTTETTSKKEDLEQDNPETKENDDDDDDASDYGEKEDDGEGWGGNNDGWDDLEVRVQLLQCLNRIFFELQIYNWLWHWLCMFSLWSMHTYIECSNDEIRSGTIFIRV